MHDYIYQAVHVLFILLHPSFSIVLRNIGHPELSEETLVLQDLAPMLPPLTGTETQFPRLWK